MARTKKKYISPLEVAAQETVSSYHRQHGQYRAKAFTERDLEGGLIDNIRMERVAPVKILERLFHPPRGISAFDDVLQISAFRYYATLEMSRGFMNHELKERVDRSFSHNGKHFSDARARALKTLVDIEEQLPSAANRWLTLIFKTYKDFPYSALSKRPDWKHGKENIMKALEELARYYGYMN